MSQAIELLLAAMGLRISHWKVWLDVVLSLVFLVPTTLLFHGDVSDSGQRIQLLKNLAIIGGLLLVADQESRS